MKCARCNKAKKPSDFYGNDASCKDCRKAIVKSYRLLNLEKVQAYDRKRGQTLKRKALVKKRYHEVYAGSALERESKERWLAANREKRAVHIMVGNAIRDSKLIPEPCERCGKLKVDAHHEDYSKPWEIMWLCKKHHGERHREINEQQRATLGTIQDRGEVLG